MNTRGVRVKKLLRIIKSCFIRSNYISDSSAQQTIESQPIQTPRPIRSEREEELSFKFMMKYEIKLRLMEDNMFNSRQLANETFNYDERLKYLLMTLETHEELKEFCYSRGLGGIIYFDDMWQHLHNARHPNFRYIESTEKEIEFLLNDPEEARLFLAKKETSSQNRKKLKEFNAEQEILKILENEQPVLQTDIYEYFDALYKNNLQRTLKTMDENGIIIREKKGNTYLVKPKNYD